MKKYLILVFGIFLTLSPYWIMRGLGYQTFRNLTDSLPGYYFIGKEIKNPRLNYGDLVAFSKPEYQQLIIKKVAGLPGDVVESNEDGVVVNGRIYEKYAETKKTLITPMIIPEDSYFVVGESKNSFDSRYCEFGLINASSITHKAWRVI